ncbi:hypothetical protein [Rhizobium sp. BR 362]|uniref:hypothetical protein n=1 Tax=Rhizobium sp. BR 362 TaxID=3040670 RepID=UPI002F420EEA
MMWIAADFLAGFIVCAVLFGIGAGRLDEANELGAFADERERLKGRVQYWRKVTAAFYWTACGWLAVCAALLPISLFVDGIDEEMRRWQLLAPLLLAVISSAIGLFCWRAGMMTGDKLSDLEGKSAPPASIL